MPDGGIPAGTRPEPASPGRVRAIEDLAAGIAGRVGTFEVAAD
ncbi:hypothetical protein [Actinomyces oris]|nr:hypothetical protein [Actinomyces oris]